MIFFSMICNKIKDIRANSGKKSTLKASLDGKSDI